MGRYGEDLHLGRERTRKDDEMAKRKRRNQVMIVAEQAAAYGVKPPVPTDDERWLSPNEAATILNVTGEAVKQWIYHRRLPAVKLANGFWKIRVKDFEAFLAERYSCAKPAIVIFDTAESSENSLGKMLEALGFRAIPGRNVTDFLLKALEQQPSLFVIALSGNGTEAWKAVERVRESKQLSKIPVLLFGTRDLQAAETERLLNLGVQGFRKLPISQEELGREIKGITKGSFY